MCEPRIENGMIGNGDGPPDETCELCGAQVDDCECNPDTDWDESYQQYREELADDGQRGY